MPLVAKHQGRVFKVAGDGVMVEFASAVNAVECAVELQQAMASANRDIVAERHIILRVGINLGDVMVEGSDLYGDGVNVAARLNRLQSRASSSFPPPHSSISRERFGSASKTLAHSP